MILYPNAKINIGLRVLSQRPDGYHNISSLMVPFPLYDVMEIREGIGEDISYSGLDFNTPEELLSTMYKWLRKDNLIPKLRIHLHKLIPLFSGLGGGSSDLAHFVNFVHQFDGVRENFSEVQKKMFNLSSDSRFFLENKPCLVAGRGEEIMPVAFSLKGHFVVLFFPDFRQSTEQAYEQLLAGSGKHVYTQFDFSETKRLKTVVQNDFESAFVKKYPAYTEIQSGLYKRGALLVSLTGTGSCFYGIFNQSPELSGFANLPSYRIYDIN